MPGQRVKGPHNIQFGGVTILDVEEVEVDYSQDSEEYDTLQGNKRIYDTTVLVEATLTLLANDVDALKVFVPDYWVAQGETLSTGETVDDPDGAIDITPGGCVTTETKHAVITSCSNPNQSFRIPECSVRIDGVEFDGAAARKVMVKLRGEHTTPLQFYPEGAVETVS